MKPSEVLEKAWAKFVESKNPDDCRKALDEYIDTRVAFLIASCDYMGASLIRVGSVDEMLKQ